MVLQAFELAADHQHAQVRRILVRGGRLRVKDWRGRATCLHKFATFSFNMFVNSRTFDSGGLGAQASSVSQDKDVAVHGRAVNAVASVQKYTGISHELVGTSAPS